VFSELKNRGVEDVFIAVCDGLKGLPEEITTTRERTVVHSLGISGPSQMSVVGVFDAEGWSVS
jgi:hypothetical protein